MPPQSLPGKQGGNASEAANVFLNLPYDKSVIDLFLAYVAGLTTLGLFPRATLEIPGGERRLDRTLQLITECRYSVHELSPIVSAGKWLYPPRLNMSFELGLTVALDQAQPGRHTWFVFAGHRAQLDRSLSDLGGTDAYFHRGRMQGVFRELGNAFVRSERQPTVQDMEQVLQGLQESLPRLLRRAGTRSPFTARVFSDLRVLARALTE
jgi:hypothetical protein